MQYSSEYANAVVMVIKNGMQVSIKGNVSNPSNYEKMRLIAPNAATRGASYSGSALPFPCAQIAFDRTPNTADIDSNGEFEAVFTYPNSYYSHDGYKKIVSSIFLLLKEMEGQEPTFVRFELPDQHILRTLTHRPEREDMGPSFYSKKEEVLGITSEENILRRIGSVKETYHLA